MDCRDLPIRGRFLPLYGLVAGFSAPPQTSSIASRQQAISPTHPDEARDEVICRLSEYQRCYSYGAAADACALNCVPFVDILLLDLPATFQGCSVSKFRPSPGPGISIARQDMDVLPEEKQSSLYFCRLHHRDMNLAGGQKDGTV